MILMAFGKKITEAKCHFHHFISRVHAACVSLTQKSEIQHAPKFKKNLSTDMNKVI
jgi:predicted ATPase